VLSKKNLNKMFYTNITIYGLLKDAQGVPIARHYIMGYISEMTRLLSRESHLQEPLEWSIQNHCLQTFRKIISARSERLTKFSILKLLMKLAHEEYDKLPPDFNEGFVQEISHLFTGMQGRSGIYDPVPFPEFMKLHGRKAAILRSEELDKMAEVHIDWIKRYPTGIDESIQEIRNRNRRRILKAMNASEEDWNDYHWHLKNVIRTSSKLESLITLKPEEKQAIDKAKDNGLPFGITPYYVSLMDKEPHRRRDHAVRAQVIPPMSYVESMLAHRDEPDQRFDFMLEHDTSPVDLITRRYPTIVILKPYNACSQICVYCQRNWEIDDVLAPRAMASEKKLEAAIQWIREHSAISEVLVTGGDPLVMSDERVDSILRRLSEIDHIERIRIGSRMPVVVPQRMTDSLMDVITKYHEPGVRELALITHFSHPYEVTPDAMSAVQQFKRRGISVYNQAVFTLENSRKFEMVTLRKIMRLIGVDPYYIFNTKGKEETRAYRVPMARLRQEIKEEARLTSGFLRTDEPVYNVPGLGKNYLRAMQHHSLLTILPDGRRVYEFHPWEKNLSLAETFIDIDVSIFDYLQELKRRGEKVANYKSIWYYY
jgi:lysine 2,3-aminomutase